MVDWALAQRVAAGALILKPAPASYRSSDLQDQFDELTARAESLVSEATGLHSAHGSARAKVTDRPGWASANVRSIERLVGPALMELQRKRGAKLGGPSLVVGRAVAGTQLGLMLAYMATRVLGQYDLLINDEAPEDQDLVSYVGPNIVAVEEQYDFAPSQFRLWLALHEVTHRLQFTAVPWLRDHFVGLVSELLGPLSGDPAGFADMRAARGRRRPQRAQPGPRGWRGRHAGHARAAAGAVEDLGDDEPARGPRRRDHGPGRGRRGAGGGPLLQGAPRAPHPGPGRDQAHVEAARSRRQDAPVRRGRALRGVGGGDGRTGAAGPRSGRAPSGCPPWRKSATPPRGWPGPVGERQGAAPDSFATDLLPRCTFPLPGTALACAVSGGADSLALLVLAVAAGCDVTAIHVDHGLRPDPTRRPGSWRRQRRAWGAFREPPRARCPRGPTSRRGPGPPGSRCCPRGWRPGTPWTTRPRRSW